MEKVQNRLNVVSIIKNYEHLIDLVINYMLKNDLSFGYIDTVELSTDEKSIIVYCRRYGEPFLYNITIKELVDMPR